jgi:hypothetical protein
MQFRIATSPLQLVLENQQKAKDQLGKDQSLQELRRSLDYNHYQQRGHFSLYLFPSKKPIISS